MSKPIRIAATFHLSAQDQIGLQIRFKQTGWRDTASAFREYLEKAGNELIKETTSEVFSKVSFFAVDQTETEETEEETTEEIVPVRKIDLRKPSDKGKAA
jgi:hypothetical protein